MAELNAEISTAAPTATGNPPANAWSIASVASLVCGILIIVPYISGLAAMALGVIGIRQVNESEPTMLGRRLAIAGVILGLLNVVGWTAYFTMIGEISGPGRSVARLFINDLNSANAADARRQCLDNVHSDRLKAASNQLKDWGGVKSIAVLYVASDTADGVTTGSVRGTLRTPAGEHAFQLQTVCRDSSNWKISDFWLR
ncbi:MAG: DUF4190 domain-containing protein [Tepidisphaeraceae bacterium]|jgi:hypothetical protein